MPILALRYKVLQKAALDPTSQHLGHAPGLRDASTRSKRRLGIEDFADGADAGLSQMRPEAIQKSSPRLPDRPDAP